MRRLFPAPFLLLFAYGVAFGTAALGTSLPAFDDHPGQLYRLYHVVTRGPAAWAWNPGWWAGYPELQFYPPGYFYLGALVTWGTLGALSADTSYRILAWLTYLAPGATTFAALARLTGNGWLALPGAFVALTMSAGVTSGVEGGVHWGMLPARLGWALLPLLVLSILAWVEDAAPSRRLNVPWLAAPILAGIVVTHPAHAPGGIAVLLTAACLAPGRRSQRLIGAALALLLATVLTAFWTVPLLARLENTRALAWGRLDPLQALAHPLLAVMIVLAVAAWPLARTPASRVVAIWPWVVAGIVALAALVLEPHALSWLPADRLADSGWLATILASGAAGTRLLDRLAQRLRLPQAATGVAALTLVVALALPSPTLTLWVAAQDWPSLATVERGLRLNDLWAALRSAPPGRVLYVRSGVPLVYGSEWWRPHTHVTALTPIHTEREIVNGTFTHSSPVAALVYRGAAGPGPIRQLVEQLDGRSLFGHTLEELDPATFNGWAERLGIAVVVVLDEDLPRLRALESNPVFAPATRVGPFRVYVRAGGAALPSPAGPGRWRIVSEGGDGAWIAARVTHYPLWRAERNGVRLETRRGPAWDLEVKLDGGTGLVELIYAPAPLETIAALASGLAAAGFGLTGAAAGLRRLRQRAPAHERRSVLPV